MQSGSSVGICARCAHVFRTFWAPVRMLGRCLATKTPASELARKFINSANCRSGSYVDRQVLPGAQLRPEPDVPDRVGGGRPPAPVGLRRRGPAPLLPRPRLAGRAGGAGRVRRRLAGVRVDRGRALPEVRARGAVEVRGRAQGRLVA